MPLGGSPGPSRSSATPHETLLRSRLYRRGDRDHSPTDRAIANAHAGRSVAAHLPATRLVQAGWGPKGDELSCRDAAHARRWRDAAPRAPRDELKDPVRRRRARPPTRNQNCDNQSTSCPRCSFSPSCRVRTPAWGMPTSSVITIWALYPAARGTNSHLRHHPGTAGGALGLRGRRLGYGTP